MAKHYRLHPVLPITNLPKSPTDQQGCRRGTLDNYGRWLLCWGKSTRLSKTVNLSTTMIMCYLSKAFVVFPLNILLGILGTQIVSMRGASSYTSRVPHVVPHGSVLDTILFLVAINNIIMDFWVGIVCFL